MKYKDVVALKHTNIILMSGQAKLPTLDLIVKAKLVKDIVYHKFGKEIQIIAGTEILVDLDTNIACHGEDHMDIDADEYEIVTNFS